MTPIQIEDNILASADLIEICHQFGSRVAIITDSHVEEFYGRRLEKHFKNHDLNVHLFSFPGGEFYKTRTTKEMIEDQMMQHGLGRDTCVLGLGGGVTLDLAGFIASTYCRGLPFISCPTSLLAMVDSAIGGKAGVNTSFGKNLIGSFYSPEMIFIDPTALRTLPKKEVRNGLMEMVKHGLIADPLYFELFEKHAAKLIDCDPALMSEAIEGSCRIKQAIVKADAKEKQGIRRLLNFGHTVGHALEQVANYQVSHGEAVALGMLVEARISRQLGRLNQDAYQRIEQLITKLHPELPQITASMESLKEAMALDKKAQKNVARFVILQAIGSPLECDGEYCMEVKDKILDAALTQTAAGNLSLNP